MNACIQNTITEPVICHVMISFRECLPLILDKASRSLHRCVKARQSGVDCPSPKDMPMGQSTYPEQCPNDRDEGYSRR